jgi:hypothetical protein
MFEFSDNCYFYDEGSALLCSWLVLFVKIRCNCRILFVVIGEIKNRKKIKSCMNDRNFTLMQIGWLVWAYPCGYALCSTDISDGRCVWCLTRVGVWHWHVWLSLINSFFFFQIFTRVNVSVSCLLFVTVSVLHRLCTLRIGIYFVKDLGFLLWWVFKILSMTYFEKKNLSIYMIWSIVYGSKSKLRL